MLIHQIDRQSSFFNMTLLNQMLHSQNNLNYVARHLWYMECAVKFVSSDGSYCSVSYHLT